MKVSGLPHVEKTSLLGLGIGHAERSLGILMLAASLFRQAEGSPVVVIKMWYIPEYIVEKRRGYCKEPKAWVTNNRT